MKNRNFIFIITIFILVIATFSFSGCGGNTPSSGQPSPSPSGKFTVCLDPGHPSENNAGDTVCNKLKEVEINWQVAQRLMKLLQEQGVSVVMTKKALTEYVSNKERAQIANQAKSHLFVRLHCDSGGGHGITFYYPDKQGTINGKTGPSLDIIAKSKRASEVIHSRTIAKLGGVPHDRGIKGESETLIGSQQGALTGSIYSEVPAITVEMVFLSYSQDADFIGNGDGQQKMAEALKEGIMAYLSSLH